MPWSIGSSRSSAKNGIDQSMMEKHGTTIVILTHNRVQMLKGLLASLLTIEYDPLEVIVVDNCSEDGTEGMVRIEFPQYTYIRTDKNIGVAARNLGLERARGRVIVCLDDDVFGIDDKALRRIHEKFQQDERLGVINFKVVDHYSGQICNWPHRRSSDRYADETFLTSTITEGAAAFKRVALRGVGLYPDYFFISHEGTDLALRIMDAGYKVIYLGDVVVTHYHSDLGRKKWTNYYYDTRNHFWLAVRNFPVGYMIKHLAKSMLTTFVYSLRDGYLRYWLKALMDGLLGIPRAMKDRRVLAPEIMHQVHQIDRNGPPFISLVRQRLFRRNMRL